MGHLAREAILGRAARAAGYETILWSDGDPATINPIFKTKMEAGFSRVLLPSSIQENIMRFPAAGAAADLLKIRGLEAVIMDDYRGLNDKNPVVKKDRRVALSAIVGQAHAQGARFFLVDGVPNLEFDLADVIVNLELGVIEGNYKLEWLKKMLWSNKNEYTLIDPEFFTPQPIHEKLPENAFVVMIGATDPKNATQSLLEGMVDSGYNPILLAPKSSKPEEATRMQQLQGILNKFPQHAWLWGISPAQMHTLWRYARFALVAPAASTSRDLFYAGCPFVGIFTNPSLEAQILVLAGMGLPTLRAENHVEYMDSSWNDHVQVNVRFDSAKVSAAVKRLESLGYIKNRLPDVSPFNCVDEHGAERLVKAMGL